MRSGPDRGEALAGLRVLAPVGGVASVVGAAVADPGSAGDILAAALAAACFVVWAAWPRLGVLPLALATTALVLLALAGGNLEPTLFVLSIAATVTGMLENSRWRLGVAATTLVAAPGIASLTLDNDLSTATWTAGIVLPIAITRVARRQELLAVQLAEAKAALADQRVAEERRRIARDVHDSVGHGLAAMLLHITGARHVLRRDVESADEALAEAEDIGRRSMLELRQTLGMLRAPDGETAGPVTPVPEPGQLTHLGVDVLGDTDRIDPLVATSLHRVASEALANVRRHSAGPATAARLEIGEDRAVLTIESVGHAVSAGDDTRAHYGIVGMSERMAAVGGDLQAGPTVDGWIVRASVPLAERGRTEAAS